MHKLILLFLFLPYAAFAADDHPMFHQSGLPIPRFVSLKSDEINVRVGPGKDYPIAWVYRRTNWPVEIIEEFGHWRKIRGRDGQGGWVHFRLLSGQRSGVILASKDYSLIPVYASSSTSSRIIMEAEPGVLLLLSQCKAGWCEAEKNEKQGWIEQRHLWGVYPEESFKD